MGFLNNLLNKSNRLSAIKVISSEAAKTNLAENNSIVLLDVRENHEFKNGHIRGAKNLPLALIDTASENFLRTKDTPVYVYCQSGARSTRACHILSQKGYTDIYNLGGISRWPYEITK